MKAGTGMKAGTSRMPAGWQAWPSARLLGTRWSRPWRATVPIGRWGFGMISTNLDVIWGMLGKLPDAITVHRCYAAGRRRHRAVVFMTGLNRLDRMILRLTAQRNCLDFAAQQISGLPGPVLEIGLGKGRTYDYLRQRLPERRIFAFDTDIHCPPDCVPDDGYLVLGDVRDTVPNALARIGEPAALAHVDISTHDFAASAPLVAWLALELTTLVRDGGVIIWDRVMANPTWAEVALPPDVSVGFHYVYRNTPTGTGAELRRAGS